ncbi:hypothetical protein H6F32_00795 [Anabaena sp. FACHB-1237]|uniref:hypothetical protein n=1 Tax=Anabaena sp. FACHB-1237 TaxID=2692769 RepID=UPI001680D573|nr:hypothetical protein [Anabaena sp. FACHB-1237]MBD2136148.1 hypothetical protein [Anabaena sp. FACHB-1237]
MSNNQNCISEHLKHQLDTISSVVSTASQSCQGDVMALLNLLRHLEKLHKEIRDGLFQESLPDNRQRLYSLLKNMESQGGWPYIERMRLQALLVKFSDEDQDIQDNIDR